MSELLGRRVVGERDVAHVPVGPRSFLLSHDYERMLRRLPRRR
jgi:hypothetical protein